MELHKRFQTQQVLDGGVSTEIGSTHGSPQINGDPLWSSRLLHTDPETIKAVHHSFLTAGSDIIQTVTYQASVEGFVQHLKFTEEQAFNLIKKGVELAVSVRNKFWENKTQGSCLQSERPLVAAFLGPYGVYLYDCSEYTGNYMETVTKQTLQDFHKVRIAAVIEGGADVIAFDTVPAKEESLIIAEIMESEFPDTLCWISFQCKDDCHTGHGETFKECFESLLKYKQVMGVGINCTFPQYVTPLIKSVPDDVRNKKTLVIYPNSGETWTQDKMWKVTDQCVNVPDLVPEWTSLGVLWIGGCCRITPADITQIRTNMQINS